MKNIFLTIICISTLLLGSSQIVLDISNNNADLKISFALSDIEMLAVINADRDDQFSQTELNMAYPELIDLLATGIQTRQGNRLLIAEEHDFLIESNENLLINLQFSLSDAGNLGF